MPVGVSTGSYIRFSIAAMISMAIGSQIVHHHYKPLADFPDYVEREIVNLPPEFQQKVRLQLQPVKVDTFNTLN